MDRDIQKYDEDKEERDFIRKKRKSPVPKDKPIKENNFHLYKKRNKLLKDRLRSSIKSIEENQDNPIRVVAIEAQGELDINLHAYTKKTSGISWAGKTYSEEINNFNLLQLKGRKDVNDPTRSGYKYYSLCDITGLNTIWDTVEKLDITKEYVFLNPLEIIVKKSTDLYERNEMHKLGGRNNIAKWIDTLKDYRNKNMICDFELFHMDEKSYHFETSLNHFKKSMARSAGIIVDQEHDERLNIHTYNVEFQVAKILDYIKVYKLNNLLFNGLIKYLFPKLSSTSVSMPSKNKSSINKLPHIKNEPVAAVLDSKVDDNHSIIKDYLHCDSNSEFKLKSDKVHGTAMLSFSIHNDLFLDKRKSIKRKIYTHPILNDHGGITLINCGQVLKNLINNQTSQLYNSKFNPSDIKIINLSIELDEYEGDVYSNTEIKMEDYASENDLLFIVAAGNFKKGPITLKNENNLAKEFIKFVDRDVINRRMTAFARLKNVLTVAAIQNDSFPSITNQMYYDPYVQKELPAEYNRVGFSNSLQIKPDILVDGGRMLYKRNSKNEYYQYLEALLGQNAANYSTSSKTETSKHMGTSNATAITTHYAIHIYELLEKLNVNNKYRSQVIKALLVHGAKKADLIKSYRNYLNLKNDKESHIKISKFIGHGKTDFKMSLLGNDERFTIIGYGEINKTNFDQYNIPLPEYVKCDLIITLAWFTPFEHPYSSAIDAQLFYELENTSSDNNKLKPNYQRISKNNTQYQFGTVYHDEYIVTPKKQQDLSKNINVKLKQNSKISKNMNIKYGICVTVELHEDLLIEHFYDDINDQIIKPIKYHYVKSDD